MQLPKIKMTNIQNKYNQKLTYKWFANKEI